MNDQLTYVKIICRDNGVNQFAVTRSSDGIIITPATDGIIIEQLWGLSGYMNPNGDGFLFPNEGRSLCDPLNQQSFMNYVGPNTKVTMGAMEPDFHGSGWLVGDDGNFYSLAPVSNLFQQSLNALGGSIANNFVGTWNTGKDSNELWKIVHTDFQPSTTIATNAKFIISMIPPGSKITQYNSSQLITSSSYENITNHMISQVYTASAEAEYGAKVAASTSISLTDSSLTTIQNSLQKKLETDDKTEITVGADHVGVRLVEGTIMKDADGNIWMYPTGDCTNFIIVNMTEWANLLGHYDLTGTLSAQMGELSSHAIIQNGYTYYNP